MSMTKYCGGCGFKNTYESISPKLCASCGDSFDKAFAKVRVTPAVSHEDPAQEAEAEVAAIHFSIGSRATAKETLQKPVEGQTAPPPSSGTRNLSEVRREIRDALAADKQYGTILGGAAKAQTPQVGTRASQSSLRDAPASPPDL